MNRIPHFISRLSLTQLALATLIISLGIRLITLPMYSLMDTTEARYGEMARIMFETQNWITPMFDYDVPFWGKPPLFAWLSAGGISLFGNNEFAVRVPHLFVGVLILTITYQFCVRAGKSVQEAMLSVAVLATSTAFIVISGAVMTDTALALGITLSMASFWLAFQHQSKLAGYLFFVGLAIGMLAKGPLTLVLIGISLFCWTVLDGRWRRVLHALPWVSGTLLMLAISLPWYMLAEFKTPGFLNYFLVGEHFMRFVVSGWEGDLYGTAHNEPRGTIWLYAAIAALPWTPLFFWQLLKRFRQGKESVTNAYAQYLWCWMLSPLVLFTFAGNILASYVLPGLPAFALLIALYQSENPLNTRAYLTGLTTPVLILFAALALNFNLTGKAAENALLTLWEKQPEARFVDLYYVGSRPFSAQYYSNGKAKRVSTDLQSTITELEQPAFIVHAHAHSDDKADMSLEQCQQRAESKKRVLLYCVPNRG
ncbi:ArnT family glycosyltransferase [Enterovibrio norvegicus]|uniref:Glycosyltransferase n=1 Tax=Enterovibrio norvegicus TaxID=188144 RepID=A0A2N7L961_9GAMM|nr:glycosyltransferase family 39 protein [Enterovibrio norvegicus]PMN90861.1 glycosyltransferase [Enterovibrio norvegicus]